MKTFIFITLLVVHLQSSASGNTAPDTADYTVPTTAELVPYSRFKVKIVNPYSGDDSQTISYIFPADLTGIENQTITLKRIAGTNNWESPEMTASCVESGELFSCNIYLTKKQSAIKTASTKNFAAHAFASSFAKGCNNNALALSMNSTDSSRLFFNPDDVETFLKKSGFEGDVLTKKLAVARAFSCSEPAGILSYEFQ